MANVNDMLNTSYAREYTVVSKGPDYVILRVADDALYQTYWQQFISADIIPPHDRHTMYVRIEQTPPAITLIDQFSSFVPEMPIVYLEVDGKRYNISSKVVTNTPNTEVPGLFRLDYRINLNADVSSVFWESYVSIQQRPLLRKAAAGWVRDSYIIKTLNRLVMEPQFMEALHAAGEPLYGFMQANQHPSIRAGQLPKYADVQVWGAGKAADGNSATIFITGLKIPQGSVVVYNQRMLQLQEPVFPDVAVSYAHMDAETHTRAKNTYSAGEGRRIGKTSYVCIENATSDISFDNTAYWRKGYLYRFALLGDEPVVIPDGRLPFARGSVEHIWVTVDNQGYPFWVDITRTTTIGAYRGHYNKNDFADYNSDDIVSYINENAIRLFARKHTDIQDESTLIYPPGHYLNPAWEEIYCHMPDDYSPLVSDYSIVPHTNASNAVIAKTWSVSEEMCTAYSHMVGIPQSIMEACGAKWSALLFALLVHMRNTYDGLRICMRAVGLDIKNLALSEPSIAYYCRPENAEAEIDVKDIYAQHENLRKLVRNISTLEPFGAEGKAEEGALRYDPDDKTGCSIQQYSGSDWVTRYRVAEIEPTQNFNNRYYDCDLDVLARLAADTLKDLGDGKPWIKASVWAGAYSRLVADVIAYEIPIYVWVRVHMWLYDESKIENETAVYSGVLDGQRCGAKNIIELFPARYFSKALRDYVKIPTGVFAYVDGAWTEIPPSRYNRERDSQIYEFDTVQYPIRIRALDLDNNAFIRYWQSTHTFGLLGLASSGSTDNFINVTDPSVTDESNLMLANGYVGVTAIYRRKGPRIAEIKALRWQYVLNEMGTDETWKLSDTAPFTKWDDIEALEVMPFEGTLAEFKSKLAYIKTGARDGSTIPFEWDNDTLILMDNFPHAIYCNDMDGNIIAIISLAADPYTLTQADWNEYKESTPQASVMITLTYG